MVAVIALLRGWDVKANGLRTAAFLCLLGSDAAKFMQEIGLPLREGPAPLLFANLPSPLLQKIDGIIAAKLLVGAAKTGVLGMVKFVPVVGGLVNGALDGLATRSIGKQADLLFPPAPGVAPPPTA